MGLITHRPSMWRHTSDQQARGVLWDAISGCARIKNEPAPPQEKENLLKSQLRTRVVAITQWHHFGFSGICPSSHVQVGLPAVAILPPSPCLAHLPFPRPLLSQGLGSTLRHPGPPRGLR